MPLAKIDCPHCGAVLKSSSGLQMGKKITCPKCYEPFVVSTPPSKLPSLEGDGEEQEERGQAKRLATGRPGAAARAHAGKGGGRASNADDEELEPTEDSPRRKKRRRGRRQAAPNFLIIGVIVGAFVLLLAGVVVVVALSFRRAAPPAPSSLASAAVDKGGGSPLAPKDVPAGWEEIVSVPGRFRVVMPSPFIERSRTMPSPVGSIKDYQYLHEASGENFGYSITFADFSETQLQKQSLEQIIDAGRDEMMKLFMGQAETDRKLERAGRSGRELVIHVPGRGRFLMHYYIDGPRLYTITMVGPKATLETTEARAFFNSFRFTTAKQ